VNEIRKLPLPTLERSPAQGTTVPLDELALLLDEVEPPVPVLAVLELLATLEPPVPVLDALEPVLDAPEPVLDALEVEAPPAAEIDVKTLDLQAMPAATASRASKRNR
jgi:hypothetical protein